MEKKRGYSFKKGYNKLRACDQEAVRVEIMQYLGFNTRQAWYNRLNGVVQPTIGEYQFITELINKFGVKKREIWEVIEL